ncbi:MAG: recombinase family protein [Bacteroidetes bacterium]|nr:recombinase family protein [Bacteroidota bacterium]
MTKGNTTDANEPPPDRPLFDVIWNGAAAAQMRNRMENFMAGFFNGQPPYGYRPIPLPGSRMLSKSRDIVSGPFLLELGDPDDISVVHYIFDAFVDEGITKTQILQALVAQGVKAPVGTRQWTQRKIQAILSDPVYIGANRHTGYYRHDVFLPIVSKSQFYRAQALLTLASSPTGEFLKFHTGIGSKSEEPAEP